MLQNTPILIDKKDEIRQSLIEQSDSSINKSDQLTESTQDLPLTIDKEEARESNAWIAYSLLSMLCFTTCNSLTSVITQESGPHSILYLSTGALLSGITYYLVQGCKNRMKPQGKFWVDQNLIVQGRLKPRNLLGFALYAFQYFLIQSMCSIIYWFAHLASLNVGYITLIWALSPFFIATADYIMFRTKLRYFHYVGSFMIVICLGLLSMRKLFNSGTGNRASSEIAQKQNIEVPQIFGFGQDMPEWLPITLAVVFSIQICFQVITVKYLTKPDGSMRFNATNLTMSGISYVNAPIFVFALAIWFQPEDQGQQNISTNTGISFNSKLFWMGIFASIANTVGMALMNKAFSLGPASTVEALVQCNAILLVIEEIIRFQRRPLLVELIAILFGFLGALELTMPHQMEKLVSCGRDRHRSHKKNNEDKWSY